MQTQDRSDRTVLKLPPTQPEADRYGQDRASCDETHGSTTETCLAASYRTPPCCRHAIHSIRGRRIAHELPCPSDRHQQSPRLARTEILKRTGTFPSPCGPAGLGAEPLMFGKSLIAGVV